MLPLLFPLLIACATGGPIAPGGAPAPVRVEAVAPVAVARNLTATGTVRALDSAELRVEVAGLVDAVEFTDGQSVSRGQVLVRLRGADAEAALLDAQARTVMAMQELTRARGLFDKDDLSQAELDRAIAADSLARAALVRADEGIRKTTLRAPFDGTVGRRDVSPGELVDPTRVLTRLDGLGSLRVDVSVPEAELARLTTSLPVLIEASALPGLQLSGRVAYVATHVDETNRTIDVRVEVDDPERRLRPGMTASVKIVVGTALDALFVPSQAVAPTANGATVWVLAEGKVTRRPVTTGERLAERVEVLSGLVAGEQVVVEGLARLREGAPVEVQAAP